eukprot:363896-Chlamydomonas_euryale.AAC.5
MAGKQCERNHSSLIWTQCLRLTSMAYGGVITVVVSRNTCSVSEEAGSASELKVRDKMGRQYDELESRVDGNGKRRPPFPLPRRFRV